MANSLSRSEAWGAWLYCYQTFFVFECKSLIVQSQPNLAVVQSPTTVKWSTTALAMRAVHSITLENHLKQASRSSGNTACSARQVQIWEKDIWSCQARQFSFTANSSATARTPRKCAFLSCGHLDIEAAVTLELKKRAKQTNMLEPRIHESYLAFM